jgi:hypothetical protein
LAGFSGEQLKIGATDFKYGETLNGKTFDTENGWLPSFGFGAGALLNDHGWWPISNLYLRLDGGMDIGSVHYNGGIQGLGPIIPYQTMSRAHIYTLDGKIGRAIPIGDMVMLTPFADIGTRYWDRHIPGSFGITEDYSDAEAMGGLMLQFSPMAKWVFGLTGEAGTTLGPTMQTQGVDFPLGNSIVWQTDAKVGYTFSQSFEITGDVGLKGFNYGNSSEIDGAMEPNSSTHEFSALIGIAYHWRQ